MMFCLMSSTLFLTTLLPYIFCASNTARSENGIDVAYKIEDIFGSNLTRLQSAPSKIDLYVNDWIRKILEVNKIGSPGDFKNGSSFPPVAKDHYFIGMKWMIKKYCFNVSSNTACMQVVLKPHEDENVPFKLRLFWGATDSDSTVKHFGKKKLYKGSDIGKQKKKYHKDDEYYKSLNAFDQFYKELGKRKIKLLHSPKKAENDLSTKKLTEKSLFSALSEPVVDLVSENLKGRVTQGNNTKKNSMKKTTNALSKIYENGAVPKISEYKIMYDPFEKEIDKIDNEEEAMKSERNEYEEDENEIKERMKRAAKNKNKQIPESTPINQPATKNDEEEDDEEDDDEEEEEEEDEEGPTIKEGEYEDAGLQLQPNQYPLVVAQGDVNWGEHLAGGNHAAGSSADDTSEHQEGPENQAFYYAPEAQYQGAGYEYFSDPDAQNDGAFFQGAQDWNRCQLPPPRKTSEVLCKVLPKKMVCKLYCIHGHTFPEGIIRQTDCELRIGSWTRKFEECLPFVDCTLKLRTAGYLKCTTNTVQTGPRCEVECQKYAELAATEKKTHQCDATGRWDPPLPHCVEREGIDVVQPPPTMYHGKMDYPQ